MNNVSYILNLTRSFNADNFLYYFLPGISSGKILLFDILTKNSIPIQGQKKEIDSKLQQLKDHWDIYNLNPNNRFGELKINVVLDLEEWDFLNCGVYSCLPGFKINYLKELLKSHFNVKNANKVIFQYFILCNEGSELEKLIQNIDLNKGKLSPTVGCSQPQFGWVNYTKTVEVLCKKFDIQGYNANDKVPENLKQSFEAQVAELSQKIAKGFVCDKDDAFSSFLCKRTDELESNLFQNIVYNKDLNDTGKKLRCVDNFFETFSSSYYLQKGKTADMVFWFPLICGNVASSIHCYEALTAFLVESVDFFEQADPLGFITCGENNPLISIKNIEFNEEQTATLFGMYEQLSQNKEDTLSKDYDKKVEVKQFFFNKQLSPDDIFKLDLSKQNRFVTIDNLRSKVPLFFSKNKEDAFIEEFKNNTIDDLEERIKIQSSRTADATELEGDYKLGETTEKYTLKEIEAKIEKLKDEESRISLESDVDLDSYNKIKDESEAKKRELITEFLKEFHSLPKLTSVLIFGAVFFVLFFAFFASLYQFPFWLKALGVAGIITAILLVTSLSVLLFLRSKVLGVVEKIKLENVSVFQAFETYVSSLRKIAIAIRESTLRRKNIFELERVRDLLKSQSQKHFLYANFYKEIVELLTKKSKKIVCPENHLIDSTDYSQHPYHDNRIANRQILVGTLTVQAGRAIKKYTNDREFRPILNVIEKIEIS